MTLHLTAESSFMGGDIKLKYSDPAFVFLNNVFGQTIQEVSLWHIARLHSSVPRNQL